MQLSEILSKPIISLYDGTNEGFVLNACFNKTLQKLKYLVISGNEDAENEEIYLLDVGSVFDFGQDAIVIKNNGVLELCSNLDDTYSLNNPINSVAFDTKGTRLGTVRDVTLDNALNVAYFMVDGEELDFSKLASFSNGTVIFQGENIVNVKKLRPNFKKSNSINDTPVKILSLPKMEEDKKYTLQEATIQRLTGNTSLLLGRKLTRQIQTQNGELIAKKDARITPKIITTATHHQKLRELALYSE